MIKLRGFSAAVSAALLAGGLALAAPASAEDEWEMPDVVGGTLEAAQAAVGGLSEDVVIPTESLDQTGIGRLQLSPANWEVCETSPEAGETLTAESTVEFVVVRLTEESCE